MMNISQRRDTLVIGSDQKPPVLFKDEYEMWVNRFKLFIRRKENGHLIWKSIVEGPAPTPVMTVDGKIVPKYFTGYSDEENVQYFVDIEARNYLV